MRGKWIGWMVMALVVATLTGCGALSSGKRSSTFQHQMLAFENAVRWGEFQSADKFRKREPSTPPTDFSAYEGVRITAYNVLGNVPSSDGSRIQRTVKIDYYYESSPGVRSVTQQQIWEYDPQGEVWMLLGPLPAFK